MDSGRTTVLLLVVVLSTSLLAGVAYSSDTARQTTTDERYTLFGVQADGWFGNDNGYAAVVDESGTTVWFVAFSSTMRSLPESATTSVPVSANRFGLCCSSMIE